MFSVVIPASFSVIPACPSPSFPRVLLRHSRARGNLGWWCGWFASVGMVVRRCGRGSACFALLWIPACPSSSFPRTRESRVVVRMVRVRWHGGSRVWQGIGVLYLLWIPACPSSSFPRTRESRMVVRMVRVRWHGGSRVWQGIGVLYLLWIPACPSSSFPRTRESRVVVRMVRVRWHGGSKVW